jgi:hypothetical protein
MAIGRSPSAVAHRAAVLGRAGPFGRLGFPKPMPTPRTGTHDGPREEWHHSAHGQVVLAVGAVLAVAITAAGLTLAGNNGHGKLAGGKPPVSGSATVASVPGPGASGPASSHGPGKATHTASPAATTTSPGRTASPTSSSTATTPAATTPPPTPTKSPSASPTKASPTPTRSPSPSPSPGTLQVSPAGGQLTVPSGGGTTITLTAQGGPVTWSVTVSAGNGHVGVTPSAGTLRAGASVAVTISASRSAAGRELTVAPGGAVFTIATGQNGQLIMDQGRASPAMSVRGGAGPFNINRQLSISGAPVVARRYRNKCAQCGLIVTEVTKSPLR